MRESEFTHWIPDYFFEGPTITAIEGRSRQDECLCTNTQGEICEHEILTNLLVLVIL